MTAKEWLEVPEAELPVKLAEVLTPGPVEHEWELRIMGTEGSQSYECMRCETVFHFPDRRAYLKELPCCPIPDPVKIDWNTAMEWFRKTKGAIDCLFQIWQHHFDNAEQVESWGDWLAMTVQPKHYLLAAAIAAEGEQE